MEIAFGVVWTGLSPKMSVGAPLWLGQLIGKPPTLENVWREHDFLRTERHEAGPHRVDFSIAVFRKPARMCTGGG